MKVTQPVDLEQCGAKTRVGRPCSKQAGWGTTHLGTGRCRLHGGASPNAELSGQLVLARREAAVMGQPLAIEPHEAILECIRISAGEVAYASERIAELEPDQAVGPVVIRHTRPRKFVGGSEVVEDDVEDDVEDGEEATPIEDRVGWVTEVKLEAPALHIWIQTRHQAMDRLVTYSKVAIAAGIEERRVRLAEQQGQLIATAIRGILAELGVADRPEAPGIVRRHLQLVAGTTN